MDRVKGKVGIVTGGASGIGEATAKLLAKEGARVAIVDIDDENGHRVAAAIKDNGGTAGYWHMDISREKEVEKTFAAINREYGQLDILVNNAGIAGGGRASHETSAEEWDRVMNVNLRGTFLCTKHAVPYILKSGGGSVINVSSIMGILGGPTPGYCASKGGIRTLTKADAVTYARQNIRFNSVHPGYIITPLFRKLAAKSPGGVEGSIKAEGERIPMGRMGMPEEIASGILFLASDESSYITGLEMIIDGGKIIV
jgi:NAD(P)-dependent dehydrogenase (short-subunit alcohol dehydrogenase family)